VTHTLSEPASLAGLGDTLWARADAGAGDGAVIEADEENNAAYTTLGALPDLMLTAGDIQGNGPLTITVRNSGVITASGAALSVRLGGLTGTLLHSDTLSTLAPGALEVVTLSLAPGSVELWAQADPAATLPESNEGNNLAVREMIVFRRLYLPLVLRQTTTQ
jgi:subtilase family serine protease